jgi:leucyl aminopeptidase
MDIAASAWTGGAKKGGSGRPVPLLAELILKGNL